MIKTFTQDEIVKYVYGETTAQETIEIETALVEDSKLYSLYKELVTLKGDIAKISETPSESTVQNILSYSKSRRVLSV